MTDSGELAIEALKQVTTVLGKLSAEQLEDLVAGRGQLAYQSAEALVLATAVHRPPATEKLKTTTKPKTATKPKAAFSAAEAAVAVQAMSSAGEIVEHLEQRGWTVSKLRELAEEIGPSVVLTSRKKDEIVRDIADAVAGHRQRSAAMSAGGWG